MVIKRWLAILSEKREGEDNLKVDVGRWSSEFPDIVEEVEKEP